MIYRLFRGGLGQLNSEGHKNFLRRSFQPLAELWKHIDGWPSFKHKVPVQGSSIEATGLGCRFQ